MQKAGQNNDTARLLRGVVKYKKGINFTRIFKKTGGPRRKLCYNEFKRMSHNIT